MEKFEVCFELNPNSSEDFFSRESIITSYLPEDPPEEFTSNWTEACPKDTYQLSKKYQFNIIPKELVSRLLVRLHQQMEEKAIWRYGLFLESQKVKITILADLNKNKLDVFVRGAESEIAKNLMETISEEINTVSKNYSGIKNTFKEEETEIPHHEQEKKKKKKWWELITNNQWETRGDPHLTEEQIKILHFYKNGVSENEELEKKLSDCLSCLGGDLSLIEDAHALVNPNSLSMFESYRINLAAKQIRNPSLFLRKDWENSQPFPQAKKEAFQHHEEYLNKFPWNQQERVRKKKKRKLF